MLHPRLSPDGEKVAFTDAGRVWVMDIFERRPRRLTADAAAGDETGAGGGTGERVELFPVWAPDGFSIAFVGWTRDDGPGQLYQVGVDGDDRPRPVARRGGWFAFPAYSPQGLQLVALRGPRRQLAPLVVGTPWRLPSGGGPVPAGLELVVAPARGITLGDPLQPVGGLHRPARPHFSDDPARVWAWQGERGLVSMRFDGSDRRVHLHVTAPAGPGSPGSPDDPPGRGNEQEEREPPVDEVMISPRGDRVLIHSAGDVWWMPLPATGGEPLHVSLADPGEAPLPLHRLGRGVEFAAWSVGGTALTGSRERSFLVWFLDRDEELEVEVPPVR